MHELSFIMLVTVAKCKNRREYEMCRIKVLKTARALTIFMTILKPVCATKEGDKRTMDQKENADHTSIFRNTFNI